MVSYKRFTTTTLSLAVTGALVAGTTYAAPDSGQSGPKGGLGNWVEQQLQSHSRQMFGIIQPLQHSSTASISGAQADADPTALITLAKGLKATVVSAQQNLGPNVDMMTLWPTQNPTHLIVCNEQDPEDPGIQRVRLSDGMVETILTGTDSCDPAHATPWGTVVVGEEAGSSGTVLEIIDPLHTTGVEYDRDAGTFSGADADNVVERPALGHLSYEGLAVYPNGVAYYGDENRPFQGTPGGAYFKFVPAAAWEAGDPPITDLDESPLAAGQVYGLRLGLRSGGTDYGQGNNTGFGTWVMIENSWDANLRAAAAELSLTGYYRPEDLAIDQYALAEGLVRFCGNNTGNESTDHNWGEAICVTDGTLEAALLNTATPELQLFVPGTSELAMMDNMAYQPGRGNWILQEDGDGADLEPPRNNDIWACLEDSNDIDNQSDGCIRIATLNDLSAETTGGFFNAAGDTYYVSIQHNVTGHGVILAVTGWK